MRIDHEERRKRASNGGEERGTVEGERREREREKKKKKKKKKKKRERERERERKKERKRDTVWPTERRNRYH